MEESQRVDDEEVISNPDELLTEEEEEPEDGEDLMGDNWREYVTHGKLRVFITLNS